MKTKMDHSIPIDILKGLAVISVILLHSWKPPLLLQLGAPYYIWQAVPIFIIIAAYNGINSFIRSNATTPVQCYNNIFRRIFSRLIFPYGFVFLIEYLYIFFINWFMEKNASMIASITGESLSYIQAYIHTTYSYPHIFYFIITGCYGPGSYFIPLLIQLVFISPILYLLARKNALMMLMIAFFIDMAFEAYALISDMPDWIYRLVFIRYLFAFGLGIYLAFGINRKWLAFGCIISVIYITAINYLGYLPLAQPSWGSQNALSFVYPLTLVVIGLSVAPKRVNNAYTLLISEIGKASYHIFLTQMVYFWAIGYFITRLSIASFIINIIICISVGLAFYYFSQIISNKVKLLS